MSELKVDCININMYGMNSYIVSADDEAMIIDIASLSFGYDDYKKLLDGKKLVRVIYTHGHFDHISGADDIRKEYPDAPHCVLPPSSVSPISSSSWSMSLRTATYTCLSLEKSSNMLTVIS